MKLKTILSVVIAVVINLATLYLLEKFGILNLRYVSNINIVVLSVAFALLMLHWLAVALRGVTIAYCLGIKLRLTDALKTHIASMFLALTTPSYFGGEALRIALYRHYSGSNVGNATALVFTERVLDDIVLAVLTVLALVMYRKVLEFTPLVCFLAVAIFVVPTIVLTVLAWYITKRRSEEKLRRWVRVLASLTVKVSSRLGLTVDSGFVEVVEDKVIFEFREFAQSLRVISKSYFTLVLLITESFVMWALLYLVPYPLLAFCGANVSATTLVLLSVFAQALMSLPVTPGASGLAEYGMARVLSYFVDPATLGYTIFWWRFLTYYLHLAISSALFAYILSREVEIKKLVESGKNLKDMFRVESSRCVDGGTG